MISCFSYNIKWFCNIKLIKNTLWAILGILWQSPVHPTHAISSIRANNKSFDLTHAYGLLKLLEMST